MIMIINITNAIYLVLLNTNVIQFVVQMFNVKSTYSENYYEYM